MTTTGCAKYSHILEKSNFGVIIVEEAAEVFESHILSLLTKNTKKLILIGDHNQLRPKPYNYELETKYNFNISMFERLVNNKIDFGTLIYQRRMKPLFADFVRIIYGDNLYKDHESVINKEKVKGIDNDMYIITHNYYEEENKEIKSKFNRFESSYLIQLCKYLLKQGYKNNQITILTFYLQQIITIRECMRRNNIEGIRVSSIDNYQGEECDIILLSLVRSNKMNKIGFLRDYNRVCVAFSRAKIGFYIIGNIECIKAGEKERMINIDPAKKDIWEKIYNKAKEFNIIGDKLTLACQTHKNKTIISCLKDFDNIPLEGGCTELCKKIMKCGHPCEKRCHNIDDCNDIKCQKPCKRIKLYCSLKIHQCKKKCYEKCEICEEIIDKKLPCGHIKKGLKCSVDIHSIKCEEIVDKELPCGHIKTGVKCFEDIYTIKCEEKCNKELNCGHICNLKCFEKCDSQPCRKIIKFNICEHISEIECNKFENKYQIICQQKCNKILSCGHPCRGTCGKCLQGTLHIGCEGKCNKNLLCGHRCNLHCDLECVCTEQYHKICEHTPNNIKCGDKNYICQEQCNIGCKHNKCPRKCGQLCYIKPCNERCNSTMNCGHQCYGLCGERCPDICLICKPDEKINRNIKDDILFYQTKCGHIFDIAVLDKYF
jgi:hypothetical protein